MKSLRSAWKRRMRPGRWFRKFLYMRGPYVAAAAIACAAVILTVFGTMGKQFILSYMDKPDYSPLLGIIAKGESNGNYNAYFGNAGNTRIRFTEMTINEVMLWQDEYVRLGNPSNAVGKYQIIRPTLEGLVKELDLNTSKLYDETMQDRLAVVLLERRGANDFVRDKLTREQFAANLAKEWAALPRITGPNPEQSYYAGDGLNHVRVSIEEVFTALATIRN